MQTSTKKVKCAINQTRLPHGHSRVRLYKLKWPLLPHEWHRHRQADLVFAWFNGNSWKKSLPGEHANFRKILSPIDEAGYYLKQSQTQYQLSMLCSMLTKRTLKRLTAEESEHPYTTHNPGHESQTHQNKYEVFHRMQAIIQASPSRLEARTGFPGI